MNWTEEEYQEYLKKAGQRPQPAPKQSQPPAPKKSKYHNKRTNGYDSAHEAAIAAELQLMAAGGEIVSFMEQVPFILPGGIKYIADFVPLFPDKHYEVWDAKGCRTEVYKMKKKLMKAVHSIEIIEK
jgi:hypothetical protein